MSAVDGVPARPYATEVRPPYQGRDRRLNGRLPLHSSGTRSHQTTRACTAPPKDFPSFTHRASKYECGREPACSEDGNATPSPCAAAGAVCVWPGASLLIHQPARAVPPGVWMTSKANLRPEADRGEEPELPATTAEGRTDAPGGANVLLSFLWPGSGRLKLLARPSSGGIMIGLGPGSTEAVGWIGGQTVSNIDVHVRALPHWSLTR